MAIPPPKNVPRCSNLFGWKADLLCDRWAQLDGFRTFFRRHSDTAVQGSLGRRYYGRNYVLVAEPLLCLRMHLKKMSLLV